MVPRTISTQSSGQLALNIIPFLVADGDLAWEYVLIGLPVLRHLRIDRCTVPESNRSTFHGIYCSSVGNQTAFIHRYFDRLMISRMEQVKLKPYVTRQEYLHI